MTKIWDLTIPPIIYWLRMFAEPSALVRDCLRARGDTDWDVVARFWTTPILISMQIDALVFLLSASRFDLPLSASFLGLYYLYSLGRWLAVVFVVHYVLICFRIKSRFGVVVSCYTIGVWYSPIFSLFDSAAFYTQLAVLSQVKAQNLGLGQSVIYLVEHAKEILPGAELKLVNVAFQNGFAAAFIISTVLIAESLRTYLLSDRLKTYLVVYVSSVLVFLPNIVLAFGKWTVIWLDVSYGR